MLAEITITRFAPPARRLPRARAQAVGGLRQGEEGGAAQGQPQQLRQQLRLRRGRGCWEGGASGEGEEATQRLFIEQAPLAQVARAQGVFVLYSNTLDVRETDTGVARLCTC